MSAMPRYKLYLENNRTKIVIAPTVKSAEHKFYGSPYHFRTEAAIFRIEKLKSRKKPRRKSRLRKRILGFGLGPSDIKDILGR